MGAGDPSLETLVEEAHREVATAETLQALTAIRARYLGRKGSISGRLRGIGSLSPEERGRAGQAANAAKERIESLVSERRAALAGQERDRSLTEERLDVTLPGSGGGIGHLHPVVRVARDVDHFFSAMGYSIEVGALVAGVTLAASPFAYEIASRLKPLRDFFIILFFILLFFFILLSFFYFIQYSIIS